MKQVSELIRRQGAFAARGPEQMLQPLVDKGMGKRSVTEGRFRLYCQSVAELYQDAGRHLYTDAELSAGLLEYLREGVRDYLSHGGDPCVREPESLTPFQAAGLYAASRGFLVRVEELFDDGTPSGKETLYFRPRGSAELPESPADLSDPSLKRFYLDVAGGSLLGFDAFLAALEAESSLEQEFSCPERAFLYWVSRQGLFGDEGVFPLDYLYGRYEAWKAAWGPQSGSFSPDDASALAAALKPYGELTQNLTVAETARLEALRQSSGAEVSAPAGVCFKARFPRDMFRLPGKGLDKSV